jgi:hypothetical protein
MGSDEKILKVLENLQADVTEMKSAVGKIPAIEKQLEHQGKQLEAVQADVTVLRAGQKALEAGQQTLEVKVEAIHDYQKKAHTEIMGHLIESNEISGQEQKKLEKQFEKRIERIERHLGLPPLK